MASQQTRLDKLWQEGKCEPVRMGKLKRKVVAKKKPTAVDRQHRFDRYLTGGVGGSSVAARSTTGMEIEGLTVRNAVLTATEGADLLAFAKSRLGRDHTYVTHLPADISLFRCMAFAQQHVPHGFDKVVIEEFVGNAGFRSRVETAGLQHEPFCSVLCIGSEFVFKFTSKQQDDVTYPARHGTLFHLQEPAFSRVERSLPPTSYVAARSFGTVFEKGVAKGVRKTRGPQFCMITFTFYQRTPVLLQSSIN
jgi:hypothetical protein